MWQSCVCCQHPVFFCAFYSLVSNQLRVNLRAFNQFGRVIWNLEDVDDTSVWNYTGGLRMALSHPWMGDDTDIVVLAGNAYGPTVRQSAIFVYRASDGELLQHIVHPYLGSSPNGSSRGILVNGLAVEPGPEGGIFVSTQFDWDTLPPANITASSIYYWCRMYERDGTLRYKLPYSYGSPLGVSAGPFNIGAGAPSPSGASTNSLGQVQTMLFDRNTPQWRLMTLDPDGSEVSNVGIGNISGSASGQNILIDPNGSGMLNRPLPYRTDAYDRRLMALNLTSPYAMWAEPPTGITPRTDIFLPSDLSLPSASVTSEVAICENDLVCCGVGITNGSGKVFVEVGEEAGGSSTEEYLTTIKHSSFHAGGVGYYYATWADKIFEVYKPFATGEFGLGCTVRTIEDPYTIRRSFAIGTHWQADIRQNFCIAGANRLY